VLESLLQAGFESGELSDAAIAQSGKESDAFWRIRDSVSAFPLIWSPYTSFDVSLPIQTIGSFVTTLKQQFSVALPTAESVYFGHIGDSNLHIAVHVPGSRTDFPKAKIEQLVYDLVKQFEGSVSAEHGIGTRKKAWLGHTRSEAEIQLMRTIKTALDPKNILNRGKVL
jgi:FAD/FMN-containing dehydrogenase